MVLKKRWNLSAVNSHVYFLAPLPGEVILGMVVQSSHSLEYNSHWPGFECLAPTALNREYSYEARTVSTILSQKGVPSVFTKATDPGGIMEVWPFDA
jgi:hypothetical protein